MFIKSINVDSKTVTLHNNGGVHKFYKCPFIECNLYHAISLLHCPTNGKSIVDEFQQQKKIAKRKNLAMEASEDYENKQGDYSKKYLIITLICSIIIISMPLFLPRELVAGLNKNATFSAYIAASLSPVAVLYYLMQRKRKQIIKKTDEIYQRVMNEV